MPASTGGFDVAATDFASRDPAEGIAADIAGTDMLAIINPEFLLMGLAGSLFGL